MRLDAKCRAGCTHARLLRLTVTRSACLIAPRLTSGYLASSGRIGSPAASAEVHPAGRSLVERRFHVAPEPALHAPGRPSRSNSSYSRHAPLSHSSACRSPPPSTWTRLGIGYRTRSDSSA